jgi:hypothetical protein
MAPVSPGTALAMAPGMRIRSAAVLLTAWLAAPLAGCKMNDGSGAPNGNPSADGGTGGGGGGDVDGTVRDLGHAPLDIALPPGDLASTTSTPTPIPADLGPGDLALPPGSDDQHDGGPPGTLGDGGVFTPPADDMGQVIHAPPTTLGDVTFFGAGVAFRDVSSDQGGGVWATTSTNVYYWPTHTSAGFTYDQSSGLGQGHLTWDDNYWCAGYGRPCPTTWSVNFTSVAGGMPGEAVIGNLGYIADRLDVDPSSGAVRSVVGLQVTRTQKDDSTPAGAAELAEQQQRVTSTWKVALDLNGTLGGTAYLGGWHGLSAMHGMSQSRTSGVCGLDCWDFQEHHHPFLDGNTLTGGRDVRAIAVTPAGDLWMGDADAIWFLAQHSLGDGADFFGAYPSIPGQTASYLDVFPGQTDMIFGLALDASGGLWVASYGNGLAYLAPGSYAPTYYSSADKLPANNLTGVAVDGSGDVWVASETAGVARYTPSTDSWSYYTTASGLPSNTIYAIYADRHIASGRAIYFATDNGVALYSGN